MSEICVFAGTTEGRRLCEFLAGQRLRVLACVATEYGGTMIPAGDNIEISARRLDLSEMEALFRLRRFDAVIDATHPFAAEASRNIVAACAAAGIEYLRLNRSEAARDGEAVYVDSLDAAADYLAEHPGNALLTTGSKELAPYARVEGHQERFFARVLPLPASLEACAAAGFAPSHVFALQGPFSVEMNVAMLKAANAAWLVTKDSGDSGGLHEKLEAARLAGARCLVVGRPVQPEGLDFAATVDWLAKRFGLDVSRRIDVIGIGMGDAGTLTFEADAALRACDCRIGAARMLEATDRYGQHAFTAIAPEKIAEIIESHPEYRRLAVVMSGDAGFFSGAKRLLPLLEMHEVRVIPGVSSLQTLCARVKTAWDDARFISLHGRAGSVVPEVLRYGKVFALTDGADALRRVCADMCVAGLGDAKVSVGQRLSYPDEKLLTGTANELLETDCAPLSALLIERPVEPRPLPVGLPDEAFFRDVEEGGKPVPMTKSEVRAVSISKLRLTEDAVVWDVGAGTGSISVEAALLCPKGRVYAVECREEAARLIKRNAERFALRNLEVVQGMAPEVLPELPAPSHVFIGGSSGNLSRIVEVVLSKNPDARIVVNAIALESVGEMTRVMDELDFKQTEVVQLSVARSHKAGRYRLMNGLNPVWIAAMQGLEGGKQDEN